MVPLWFAWFPVHTDKGWRWLCNVERYMVMIDYGTTPPYEPKWRYEYKAH